MTRVVLFNEDFSQPLLIEVTRWKDSKPVAGRIINGCWFWRHEGDTEYELYDGRDTLKRAKTSWPAQPRHVFIVPSKWIGNFNEIIKRARTQLERPANPQPWPCCMAPAIDRDLCRTCGAIHPTNEVNDV